MNAGQLTEMHNSDTPSLIHLEDAINGWDLSPPNAAIRFEEKLAREEGWTRGKALEVVAEYRRFLVLTQVADGPVCPSRDVDAAWHLHLTQTRDYRHFCLTVLGKFLHHEPSREGAGEYLRHRAMYAFTLEAYRRHFAEEPSPDIWPSPDMRFSHVPLSTPSPGGWTMGPVLANHWVRVPLVLLILVALGAVSTAVLVDGLRFLNMWMALVLYVSGLVMCVVATQGKEPGRMSDRATPLDAFEAAYLAGGEKRVLAAAIAGRIHLGELRIDATRKDKGNAITGGQLIRLDTTPASRLDPMEAQVLAAARPGPVDMDALARAIQPQVQQIAARLTCAGLLTLPRTIPLASLATVATLALVWAVGVAMFFGALHGSDKLATILYSKFLVFTAIALVVLSAPGQETTDKGKRALASFTKRMGALKTWVASKATGATPLPRSTGAVPAATLAVALFGSAALMSDPRYAGINFLFSGNGSVATGGSDSEGACEAGGGCGGCGGCG